MTTRVRYDRELLDATIARDGATLVGEYAKLTSTIKITFTCKCGKESSKNFKNLVNCGGAYCSNCIYKNNRSLKIKATNLKKYGVENPFQNNSIKEKIKATNVQKYGVEHPMYCKTFVDKIKATNIERYGVEHISQTEEFKDKLKSSNLKKYGVEYTFQRNKIKQKIKEGNLEKFGVEYPMQCLSVREKSKVSCLEKYGVEVSSQSKKVYDKVKATNLQKYGGTNPSHCKEIRNKAKSTNLKKYGVEHATQNLVIFEKAQSNTKKFKEYKMPSGALRKVQGYEPFALDELLKTYTEDQIKTDRKDVGRIGYEVDGKAKYYFPDIAIPHENKIIEVKSTWTYKLDPERIKQKAEATKAKGFNYEIWVFDGKGNRVNVDLEETEECEEATETNTIVYE